MIFTLRGRLPKLFFFHYFFFYFLFFSSFNIKLSFLYAVFNFTNGVHDVSEVTKENFDACDPSNPFFLITTSPATIGLNKTGQHYFICTFSCSRTRSQPCLAGSDEVSDDFHRRRQFGMDGSSECLFLSGTEQWEELHGWWTSLFSTT